MVAGALDGWTNVDGVGVLGQGAGMGRWRLGVAEGYDSVKTCWGRGDAGLGLDRRQLLNLATRNRNTQLALRFLYSLSEDDIIPFPLSRTLSFRKHQNRTLLYAIYALVIHLRGKEEEGRMMMDAGSGLQQEKWLLASIVFCTLLEGGFVSQPGDGTFVFRFRGEGGRAVGGGDSIGHWPAGVLL
jgi:hypothetical protein